MPTYEFNLILRQMSRPDTVSAIKKAADLVFQQGGFIRKMESLGERQLPQKTESHGEKHSHGTYFLMNVDLPVDKLDLIREELKLDKMFLRRHFVAVKPNKGTPICTLEEELLSPAYRPSVQEMILKGRRKPRFTQVWDAKTGLKYYPFHR